MNSKVATIHDVSAAAGVSVSTVSKYINGKKRFSSEVEARLQQAIEALGYQSNPMARSMVTGEMRSIGLVVRDIRNPHFTNIIRGANRVAIQNGYTLLLVDTEENLDYEQPLLEALSRRVDGMIVSSRTPEKSLHWMLKMKRPVVIFGRPRDNAFPSVGADGYQGAYMLSQHLINQGHRRIGFLGYPGSRWSEERIKGCADCLKDHGLELIHFETDTPNAAGGESACARIMLSPARPDAMICYNDLIAMGFMKEARTLGFHLPRDISVAGFDNIPFGEYTSPALTSVDMQSEVMGETAMRKLIDALAGNVDTEFCVLPPRLLIRESTAPREETCAPAVS